MKTKSETKSEFRLALESNIKAAVEVARAEGIVGMSVGDLFMVTPPPLASLSGAPVGTNATDSYIKMFTKAARAKGGGFLLRCGA